MKDSELKEIVQFLKTFPRQQVLLKELIIDYYEAQQMVKMLVEENEVLQEELEEREDEIEKLTNIQTTIH